MEAASVPNTLTVLSSACTWLGWSLLIGWLGHRLPLAAIDHDSCLTRPRPWGESVQSYQRRLAIRRWKGLLPDAGDAFPGGVRKSALVQRAPRSLGLLQAETRRAELVHLALWPGWLFTCLWLPPEAVTINVVFATLFNLPCLWLQRYNRLRLQEILDRGRSK